MKIFSLVLLTLLLSAAAFAQSGGSLSGKVSDADGDAVPQSQVTLALKIIPA